ncbi:sulfurtransferase [Candidimonas sp. SYP-B2681]|uniref:sulfurtransferase n=1 Tax=Candidimonas sp. SYP-B2681 TaxID=2497686 RepID=UPI000F87799C|nr:sulfurtransferase [Candidimonas sp. SYP-B2681]RTZ42549.1 sulfurtransferase [Candidimonas sp. SYP-B2681]
MTQNSLHPANGLAQADWLAANLHRSDVLVFDCTANIVADENGVEKVVAERDAFRQGHIPSAQFIDLQAELSDADSPYNFMLPTAGEFETALRKFGVNHDSIVVVYSTGNPWWATRIWWMFRQFGLNNAYVLNGGFRYWQHSGFPTESGEATPRPTGNAQAASERNLAIDGDTLRSRLGEPQLALVNALPPDKFSGKSRVHGGRPGHIPGSVNVPAASLVDPETGLFISVPAMTAILSDKQLLNPGRNVVAYCGGGISASLVVFALTLAGQENVKLYDASLSEWAHRDGFPLETTTTD